MLTRRLLTIGMLVATLGCYHQVVQTGLSPGSKVVDKPLVATWVFGLVPAQELDMRAECPGGVAIVTTEQSFMNGLLGVVTLGIYTPVHVMVTCAGGTASLPVNARQVDVSTAPAAAQRAALGHAVREALESGEPVVVRFQPGEETR
jgi:hypothetical protein